MKGKWQGMRYACVALWHTDNYTYGRIATLLSSPSLKISHMFVVRAVKRWQSTGSHLDAPRCGGRRSTSPNVDNLIIDLVKKDPHTTIKSLCAQIRAKSKTEVSMDVVAARLKEAGYISINPVRKPLLTKKIVETWLAWAK